MKTVMVEVDYFEIMEILKRLNGAPVSLIKKFFPLVTCLGKLAVLSIYQVSLLINKNKGVQNESL